MASLEQKQDSLRQLLGIEKPNEKNPNLEKKQAALRLLFTPQPQKKRVERQPKFASPPLIARNPAELAKKQSVVRQFLLPTASPPPFLEQRSQRSLPGLHSRKPSRQRHSLSVQLHPCVANEFVLFSGQLRKQSSGLLSGWDTRFFQLFAVPPKLIYVRENATIVTVIDFTPKGQQLKTSEEKLRLEVLTDGRSWLFEAMSKEEWELWARNIRTAISIANSQVLTSHPLRPVSAAFDSALVALECVDQPFDGVNILTSAHLKKAETEMLNLSYSWREWMGKLPKFCKNDLQVLIHCFEDKIAELQKQLNQLQSRIRAQQLVRKYNQNTQSIELALMSEEPDSFITAKHFWDTAHSVMRQLLTDPAFQLSAEDGSEREEEEDEKSGRVMFLPEVEAWLDNDPQVQLDKLLARIEALSSRRVKKHFAATMQSVDRAAQLLEKAMSIAVAPWSGRPSCTARVVHRVSSKLDTFRSLLEPLRLQFDEKSFVPSEFSAHLSLLRAAEDALIQLKTRLKVHSAFTQILEFISASEYSIDEDEFEKAKLFLSQADLKLQQLKDKYLPKEPQKDASIYVNDIVEFARITEPKIALLWPGQ